MTEFAFAQNGNLAFGITKPQSLVPYDGNPKAGAAGNCLCVYFSKGAGVVPVPDLVFSADDIYVALVKAGKLDLNVSE